MRTPWIVAALASFSGLIYAQETPASRARVSGSYSGLKCHEKIAKLFNEKHGSEVVEVSACPNIEGVAVLAKGDCDILMYSGDLTEKDKKTLAKAFPDSNGQPVCYLFGRYGVTVIVNKANPIRGLTPQQFAKIYTGKTKTWNEISSGLMSGKKIMCYAQLPTSNTNYIVKTKGHHQRGHQ